jgi:GNAT superfamily N-acetyltransferase
MSKHAGSIFTVRMADPDDIPVMVRHRHKMFEDMAYGTPETRAEMDPAFAEWVRPRLITGEFRCWLAVCKDETGSGQIAASAALWLMDWAPNPFGAPWQRPYVQNVYTEDAYRRQGASRLLMTHIIDFCRREGYPVIRLHASAFGRPMYEVFGFQATDNEMVLNLR